MADIVGFIAADMPSRVLALCQFDDVATIENQELKADIEKRILGFSVKVLKLTNETSAGGELPRNISSVRALVDLARVYYAAENAPLVTDL